MIKLVIFIGSVWTLFTPKFSEQQEIPFNVDLKFPVFFPPEEVSQSIRTRNPQYPPLFGSSVLVTSRSGAHDLYIGSPNLVSKTNPSIFPGSIFRCPIDFQAPNDFSCFETFLSKRTLSDYEERNRSLVGFNLVRNERSVITCAPNWVGDFARDRKLTPEGVCFLVNSNTGEVDTSFGLRVPKERKLLNNRPYESHALFGFSIAYNPDGNTLIVGMPGFNDFSGSVTNVDGSLRVQPLLDSGDSSHNTYTGFAVDYCSILDSKGFPRDSLVIVGTPRHNKFSGRVDFIRHRDKRSLLSVFSFNDSKGEYFGASLLSIDMGQAQNSVQKDLLVGAPLHSLENRREVGRVYYYKNIRRMISNQNQNRPQPVTFTSKVSRAGAHFGTSLASIDLNHDSFADVVISAPFEENFDETSGAIYIYYGRKNGLNIGSEQRIGANVFKKKSILQGFGYSLWTQSDVDNNGYNDLVIGSVLSNKVSILRTIPVIDLQVKLEFDRTGVNLTHISDCLNENSCFRVHYCIKTTATKDFADDLSYTVNFVVVDRKSRHNDNRVVVDKLSSMVVSNKKDFCSPQPFYVEMKKTDEIFDLITPIEVQVNVSLDRPPMSSLCAWCPVASPVTVSDEIAFEHGCARKRCVSNLELSVQFKYGPDQIGHSIVQGRYSNIEFVVDVRNRAESAIDTYLIIAIRPFSLMLRNLESRCHPVPLGSETYSCEVNKLLQKDQKEEFKLHFDLSNVAVKRFLFDFNVTTKSELTARSVTRASKNFSIVKKASFQLLGDNSFNYSFLDQTQLLLFPISYVVDKDGPSSVNATYVQFYLPDEVIEIDQSSKHHCRQVQSMSTFISDSYLANGTLSLYCPEQTCSRYECSLGLFDPGRQNLNFGLTLVLHPKAIPSKHSYQRVHFVLRVHLFTKDAFFNATQSLAFNSTSITFERQLTQIQPKASPLIMIGGGGIGLLILLITVILLIKNGFFKRKKREELLRVKQRMSMNPNLVLPGLQNIDDAEESERVKGN